MKIRVLRRHKSRLLGVANPCTTEVGINPGIMLHQWKVIIAAAQRDHKLTLDGHLPRSEDPHSRTCRHDRLMLLPDRRTRGKSMSRVRSTASGTRGTLAHWWWSALITGGRMSTNLGRPARVVGWPVGHLRRWRVGSSGDLLRSI
jgi:hypothetical protein